MTESIGQALLALSDNLGFTALLNTFSPADSIGQTFLDFFGNPYVATFLIAMLPIVELRGAIPFGLLYVAEHSAISMNWFGAFAMGFLGSGIVAPLILLLLIPLLNWLKKTRLFRRPANWIESKFQKKSDKLKAKAIEKAKLKMGDISADMTDEERATVEANIDKKILWSKVIGVFTFVAIPLPFTGVWTGSAVAAFLKLDFKHSLLAVLLGNLVAAIIITAVTALGGMLL